jgi:hypothetical protein
MRGWRKRDSRGRFAGGGGSSSRGGGRKPLQRGTNRLTRDNAGRITSVGGDGATARGGRLRTASGKQRATVTAKGIGKAPAGTVGRSGKVKGAASVKAAGRRAPLTGVNAVVARNPAGFKGLPVSLRNRKQAGAAQRERNRRLFEFSRGASGYDGSRSNRGLKFKKTTVNQGNLLTGKTERVTVRARPKRTGSLIGESAASRKRQVRRARAEARYESLLQQRKAVTSKGRVRSGELARINQRLSAVSGAFRTYDMGTGRRPARRRTGRGPR